jgi:CheY-like chemotaxis protein
MDRSPLLVVDDDPDACASLADVLTDLGYAVDVAHDGAAALALVPQAPYRLALLDYRMPGMNGVEVYKRARALRPDLAGLLVTAYSTDDVRAEALRVGMRNVLLKPVAFEALLPLIAEACRANSELPN